MKTTISGGEAGDGGEIIVDVSGFFEWINFFTGNSQNNLDIKK